MKKTKIFTMAMAAMMSVGAMGVNALADTDTYEGSINDIQMQEENRVTTVDDSRLSVFDEENKTIIGNILDNGGEFFFYDHSIVGNNSIMPMGTQYINLPDDSAGEQDYLEGMYDSFWSIFTYKTDVDCDMKIYATCTYRYSPANIKIEIFNEDNSKNAVYTTEFTSSEAGETFTYPMPSGSRYRIKVTNLSYEDTFIVLHVYGE